MSGNCPAAWSKACTVSGTSSLSAATFGALQTTRASKEPASVSREEATAIHSEAGAIEERGRPMPMSLEHIRVPDLTIRR